MHAVHACESEIVSGQEHTHLELAKAHGVASACEHALGHDGLLGSDGRVQRQRQRQQRRSLEQHPVVGELLLARSTLGSNELALI
jgi:hypothetical protein